MAPRPQTVQASIQTEPPSRNYDEEFKGQVAITEEAKKHHGEAIAQLDELKEQAAEREADFKRLLNECIAKLQATEKEVANIQAANTMVAAQLAEAEETHQRGAHQHLEETESLKGQIRELQTIAHQNLAMWKHTKQQKAQLADS